MRARHRRWRHYHQLGQGITVTRHQQGHQHRKQRYITGEGSTSEAEKITSSARARHRERRHIISEGMVMTKTSEQQHIFNEIEAPKALTARSKHRRRHILSREVKASDIAKGSDTSSARSRHQRRHIFSKTRRQRRQHGIRVVTQRSTIEIKSSEAATHHRGKKDIGRRQHIFSEVKASETDSTSTDLQ